MYEVRVDPDHGFVHLRFFGRVKLADGLGAARDIVAHADFRPGMNGFADLREITEVELLGKDVREVAVLVASQEDLYRGSRWAVVADSNVTFGLARQFQAMRDQLGYDLEVFRAPDEACAWLGLPRTAV